MSSTIDRRAFVRRALAALVLLSARPARATSPKAVGSSNFRTIYRDPELRERFGAVLSVVLIVELAWAFSAMQGTPLQPRLSPVVARRVYPVAVRRFRRPRIVDDIRSHHDARSFPASPRAHSRCASG
jgi:hypothetical protein